ncbi:MAG: transposase [bacterium]
MSNIMSHLGFYKHDKMPHFDRADQIQFLTFVMADAVPSRLLQQSRKIPVSGDKVFLEMDERLDGGKGSCILAEPHLAELLRYSMLSEAGRTHLPIAWVIMPNHVHLITKQVEGFRLGTVVRQIKAGSALLINRATGRDGQFWQHGYFDRAIRDMPHLAATIDYVHYNPVKAQLCAREADWQYSSIQDYDEGKVMKIVEGGVLPG